MAELQLHATVQRRHFANEASSIERRLHSVDRVAVMTRHVLGEPLVIIALVAGAVLIGPTRILRTTSRGLLLVAALRRLWTLVRR
jgi:hypothetical protein